MSGVYSSTISSVIKVSRELNNVYENSPYDYDYYGSYDSYTDTSKSALDIHRTLHDNTKHVIESTQNVMTSDAAQHHEAYYLYVIAIIGMLLNCAVVITVFVRKRLRRMTSGFLIHACFLDFLKSAYCIPIASNLLTQVKPSNCDFFGSSFVIMVTISAFNMVAMVCAEAYTFGEANVGGNSKGTLFCVVFGIVLVYIASTILHLGPTLIGGYFEFHKEIGSCSFTLGKQTGYVANIMWIVIITLAMVAVIHFICVLYKEIQINQPNRVSFLVRSSITVMDSATQSACNLRQVIKEATQRARMFILNTTIFILLWYPLFLLNLIDMHFTVNPKVYQTFSFLAWSHGAIQPVLYILFDRSLNLLARYTLCNKSHYDIDFLAQLMMNRRRNTTADQSEPRYSMTEGESFSLQSANPETRNIGRSEATVDIIREHQEMCVVQNSSNRLADNDSNARLSNQGTSETSHVHFLSNRSTVGNTNAQYLSNQSTPENANVQYVSNQNAGDNTNAQYLSNQSARDNSNLANQDPEYENSNILYRDSPSHWTPETGESEVI